MMSQPQTPRWYCIHFNESAQQEHSPKKFWTFALMRSSVTSQQASVIHMNCQSEGLWRRSHRQDAANRSELKNSSTCNEEKSHFLQIFWALTLF